jgi:hypothetical protein
MNMMNDCRWCKKLYSNKTKPYCIIESSFCDFEPYYPTLQQFKKDTGKDWPDDWPIYEKFDDGEKETKWMRSVGLMANDDFSEGNFFYVCAICPIPPPENWRPK